MSGTRNGRRHGQREASEFIPKIRENAKFGYRVRFRISDWLRFFLAMSLGLIVPVLFGCTTARIPLVSPADLERASEEQVWLAMAKEKEYVVRLHRLAWPIFRANVELCGSRVAPAIGVVLAKPGSFFRVMARTPIGGSSGSQTLRKKLLGRLATDDRPSSQMEVLAVMLDSAAEKAGLQAGDTLQDAEALNGSMGMVREWKQGETVAPIQLSIRRADEEFELEIIPDMVCRAFLDIEFNALPKLWISGSRIGFTSSFLRRGPQDSEVQFRLAYALALVAAEQVKELSKTSDESSASYEYSEEAMDIEADYIGLYMLARAGVEDAFAKDFFLRRTVHHFLLAGRLHPVHMEYLKRHSLLEAAWREIQAKIEQGLPLLPNARGQG